MRFAQAPLLMGCSSVNRVHCSSCGGEHDLSEIEPSFDRPDAYFDIPLELRAERSWSVDDLCVLWETDSTPRRHFVRALLPFQIRGETARYSWGTWVEVSEREFAFIHDHWSDPAQPASFPIPGRLANAFPGMLTTTGLAGHLRLARPRTVPDFYFDAMTDHSLAAEQRDGVLLERVIEWAALVVHP
jgi:hypothetical protein